jgi:hypothetical protein
MVPLLDQLQELWGDKQEYFSFCLLDHDSVTHYQKDKQFNVASSYKVFVLGELLRQYEEGQLSLVKPLTITDNDRIFDSSYTESMANGTELMVLELAKAMMGYSDNTATGMLQGYLKTENIMSLLLANGISNTRFPHKLRSLMDYTSNINSIDLEKASTIYKGELGIISTSYNLAKFYQLLWSKSIIHKSETWPIMKEILSIEDKLQKIQWPKGVSCFRKSGNIDLDFFYGLSLAGIIEKEEDYVPFALCLNFNNEEQVDEMLILLRKRLG